MRKKSPKPPAAADSLFEVLHPLAEIMSRGFNAALDTGRAREKVLEVRSKVNDELAAALFMRTAIAEAQSVQRNCSAAAIAKVEANARKTAEQENTPLDIATRKLAQNFSRYERKTKKGGLYIGTLAEDLLKDWPEGEEAPPPRALREPLSWFLGKGLLKS